MAESKANEDREVVVITGASSGLGHATALEFAANDYDVVLIARSQKKLQEVAKACEEQGVRALAIAADTTDLAALQKAADNVVKTFGHIDVWVNGAAVTMFAKFEEAPMEDFRQVIETNLFGYVNGARLAIKQFKDQGHGTLINITSVNATTPEPYASAYIASKYALRGLSDSLRMELELEGLGDSIHVCNAMPASVDTNLFQNAANYTHREVQALEPVYHPAYVAKHLVRLARKPKREMIIGPAGKMMAMEHATAPSLFEKFGAKMIARNHMGKSKAASETSGNLYEPAEHGLTGGWRARRLRADRMNAILGGAAAVTVAAVGAGYAIKRKQRD